MSNSTNTFSSLKPELKETYSDSKEKKKKKFSRLKKSMKISE